MRARPSRGRSRAAGGAVDVRPAHLPSGAVSGVHSSRAQAGDNVVDASVDTAVRPFVHPPTPRRTPFCTPTRDDVRRPDLHKQSSSPASTPLTTDDFSRFLVRPEIETVGSSATVQEVDSR